MPYSTSQFLVNLSWNFPFLQAHINRIKCVYLCFKILFCTVILKYFEIFYCKDARNLKNFQTDLKAWWDEVTGKEGTQNIWTWAIVNGASILTCVTFPCCGMLRLLWKLSHSFYSREWFYINNCLKNPPLVSQPHLSVYMPWPWKMVEGRKSIRK